MPDEVSEHKAKTHLSRRKLVRLTPVDSAPQRRKLGTAKGDFVVPDDFDAPLADEVLTEFER
jgi:antitoxin (DNA-binding transcriptional repressor) of toxin-antitoxin stability system